MAIGSMIAGKEANTSLCAPVKEKLVTHELSSGKSDRFQCLPCIVNAIASDGRQIGKQVVSARPEGHHDMTSVDTVRLMNLRRILWQKVWHPAAIDSAVSYSIDAIRVASGYGIAAR
jgi:hypothetical protein